MPKKVNPIEIIERLKEKYKDYDFSKSQYKTMNSPIEVVCKVHNQSFFSTCQSLLDNNIRCPLCKQDKMTDTAIARLKEIYPTYDFSKTRLTSYKSRITIMCENGHETTALYRYLLRGCGCAKCKNKRKLTDKEAKDRLLKLYPDWSFAEFEYNGANNQAVLICPNGHRVSNIYTQFLRSNGCFKCKQAKDGVEVLNKLKEMFVGWDFSLFEYAGTNKDVTLICDKGHKITKPCIYFIKGYGCKICSNRKLSNDEAKQKLIEVFPDWDYSRFVYNGYIRKCEVVCNNGHKVVKRFNLLLKGFGCKDCKS